MEQNERSQWNNEPEYQLSEDAKEFGVHKKAPQPAADHRDVFISYSSSEYAVAERLRGILKRNGITCWMAPEDIPGGSNYTKEIPSAIRDCRIFVLMLSQNAQRSHWVLKELNAAVNEGKLILPFMLENCGLIDEFNFLLSGAQWFPAFQHPVDAMEKLTERVKSVLYTEPAAEPTASTKPLSTPANHVSHAPVSPPKSQQPTNIPTEISPASKSKKAPRKHKKASAQRNICPACGRNQLVASRKQGFTASERMSRFWFAVFCIVSVVAVWGITTAVCLNIGCTFELYLGAVIVLLGAQLVLLLTVGRSRLRERIRRHRVRKHIRVSGVRCTACAKEFVLTIGETERFPWEI